MLGANPILIQVVTSVLGDDCCDVPRGGRVPGEPRSQGNVACSEKITGLAFTGALS